MKLRAVITVDYSLTRDEAKDASMDAATGKQHPKMLTKWEAEYIKDDAMKHLKCFPAKSSFRVRVRRAK